MLQVLKSHGVANSARLNMSMAAGSLMLQNSALDNLGEQAEVPEEGEQGPRDHNTPVFRACSPTRSGLFCSTLGGISFCRSLAQTPV